MIVPVGIIVNTKIAATLLFLSCVAGTVAWAPYTLAQQTAQGAPMELAVSEHKLTFENAEGVVAFDVEVADTAERRARGLMFRTDLPEDRGMLFVFERTQPVSFWMQNTPLPLDLVFIGEDGRVIDILAGEPFSTASIAPDKPSRFVLELHRGTSDNVALEPGLRLHHPVIDAIAGN